MCQLLFGFEEGLVSLIPGNTVFNLFDFTFSFKCRIMLKVFAFGIFELPLQNKAKSGPPACINDYTLNHSRKIECLTCKFRSETLQELYNPEQNCRLKVGTMVILHKKQDCPRNCDLLGEGQQKFADPFVINIQLGHTKQRVLK